MTDLATWTRSGSVLVIDNSELRIRAGDSGFGEILDSLDGDFRCCPVGGYPAKPSALVETG